MGCVKLAIMSMKCQAAGCTKKNVTSNLKPGVSCAKCSKAFHFDCAKLTREAFDNIIKHSLDFFCPKCKSSRRSTIHLPDSARDSTVQHSDPLTILTARFDEYKNHTDQRIERLDQRIERLETALIAKDNQIAELKEKVTEVNAQTLHLKQHSIENNLEVQGLPESELENPIKAVENIGAAINCCLDPASFDCSVTKSGSTQTLVIKFSSKTTRKNFLTAGKDFNRSQKKFSSQSSSHKIFVNEQLTSNQKRLLYDCKQFSLANNFRFAWFSNGQILLKRNNHSKPIVIRLHAQLETIASHEAAVLLPERERNSFQDQGASTSSRRQ